MGGVTLREVANTDVLKEHVSALLTVFSNGQLDVHHFVVILDLISNACVDEEKIHSNGGRCTTQAVLNLEAIRLTDSTIIWWRWKGERERERETERERERMMSTTGVLSSVATRNRYTTCQQLIDGHTSHFEVQLCGLAVRNQVWCCDKHTHKGLL